QTRRRVSVSEPTDEWLEEANRKFRKIDVPPRRRPWDAWRQFCIEKQVSLSLSDPQVMRIFEWFRQNTQEGSQILGPLFRSTFYCDACVWPIRVPLVFGSVRIQIFDMLYTMPPGIKVAVGHDAVGLNELHISWTSAMDCVLSIDDLCKPSVRGFSID